MKRAYIIVCLHVVFLPLGIHLSLATADTIEAKKERAKTAAEQITVMRGALAKSFIKPKSEITLATFKAVCGLVADTAKEIAKEEGFKIRHSAVKFRNPMHKATETEAGLLEKFDKNRKLTEFWDSVKLDGKEFLRYSKPIFVEEACLACHGPKKSRPDFIVEKYTEDKAYGFETGDLRGMISVMLPAPE
ncbi:MAG: DUF3365 domain-containing protein [Candidatus Latescibacteria bacterium]|nr:DUF3365 domain-containing protein [Candidatus Latescibacterota bacterium]NIO28412.1 DUF3365 domain-containing protein [Candidatus Latescibacterota bacterium]NIO55961.1 DUF3365 domain-containing protein [Candidatus Latescibacterota bacterium]NIT01925.1 DUF3365 domain-containing protein [Candidatus Latescibacterota bacterium]